ncbi:hypothetical protein DBV05_g3969 [Lasiodiplodia theobromae]|uniref:Uncharacterized protein n=1 Tax=Lasiodiplodia theobromae TaxID=45133 RepID=A0A5N5DHV4_9PEZI|nr:hypothetical protein DBV05_g3969 [Lasiodiplodia theobromae]
MASSDVDLKHLARVSVAIERKNPILAASLRQIEGNSIMLAPRLYRARKMRKLDTSRDTKSLSNYQHILWLAREGLSILEVDVLPYTQHGQYGAEAAVLTSKLRASFLHIFALFHNQPPVTKTDPRSSSSSTRLDPRSSSSSTAPAVNPPAPASTNPKAHRHSASRGSNSSDPQTPPRANQSKLKDNGGRPTGLREPIGSITSETSFVTNPYAANPAKSSAGAVQSPQPPPGLPGLPSAPRPSAFILPPLNFLPMAESYFTNASRIAAAYLPGSHPLRLSVEVEHCAFIWDCLHDHQYARRLARHTIREVYHAKEGMDDEDFEDAAKMVDHLGKVMKRKSIDTTPKMVGSGSPPGAKDASPVTKQDWMDREARAVGGGLRGVAHVQNQLARIHESLNPFETTGSLQDLPDLALAEDLLEEMRGYDGNQALVEDESEDWSERYHPNSFKMRKIGGPARQFPHTVVEYELIPRYDVSLITQLLRAAAPSDERFIAERIILRGGGPVDLPDAPASAAVLAAALAAAHHPPVARGAEEPSEYDWSPRVWRRGGERLKPAAFVADLRLQAELSAAAPLAAGALPGAPKLAAAQPVEISSYSGAPQLLLVEIEEEERRREWEKEMEELEAEIRLEMELREMGMWGEELTVETAEEKEMLLRQEIEAEMAEQEMDAVEVGVVGAVWREIEALKARGVMPCSFSGLSISTLSE